MKNKLINYLKSIPLNNKRMTFSRSQFDEVLKNNKLQLMGHVSVQELRINRVNLIDFVLALYKEHVLDDLSFEASETDPAKIELNIRDSQDIIALMVKDAVFRGFRTVKRDYIYNLIHEIDSISGIRYFFINTLDYRYPLSSIRYGNFLLSYRLPNEQFLYNILYEIAHLTLPKALSEYVIYTNSRRTIEYKKYILSMYIEYDLFGFEPDNKFDYVINDAYCNLVRLSNIGLERGKEMLIYDLNQLKGKIKENILNYKADNGYKPVYSQYELLQYENLFKNLSNDMNKMINFIRHPKGKPPFDVARYYIYDQPVRECNNLKIELEFVKKEVIKYYIFNKKISTIINDIHPDVIIGLFNLQMHLTLSGLNVYYRNSPLVSLINYILSPVMRLKPVLIKYVLKNAEDPFYHQLKQSGCILFNQLECLFGFRNSHVIIEEVREDYLNWTAGDQEKYSSLQSNHIKKYANAFFNYKNVEGHYLGEIFKRNALKYANYDEIVGHPSSYLTAQGAIDRDNFVALTTKGKTRTVSKTDFFNLFSEPMAVSNSFKWSRKNQVIIKYEEYIKQRIVINSTMRTYYPLARLNAFINKVTSGSGVMHFSNTRAQKGALYARFQRYLMYNKYNDERYILMPLDYSSYDHTITLDCICQAILELAELVGYREEVLKDIELFKHYLSQETIYFKELKGDPVNNSKYKYGVLSGWKITSSGESLLNAITSYGIMQMLNLPLVDFITMGDDLVIVLDNGGTKPDLKHLLEIICNQYQNLGYKMNVPKNSIGYYFLEFLRVVYYPGIIQGYPIRILPALTVLKPGREEALFGVIEFDTTLKHCLKRYGATSRYYMMANYLSKNYKKRDIKKMFFDYVKEPYKYKIIRKKRMDYKFKVNIKATPVYNKYLSILGSEYRDVISQYIDKELLEKGVIVTTLQKLKESKSLKNLAGEIDNKFIKSTFDEFLSTRVKPEVTNKLFIPDYHLSKILQKVVLNHPLSESIKLLECINERLANRRLISKRDHAYNSILLGAIMSKSELRDSFIDDRISVVEQNIPSPVLAQIKKNFIKFINFKIMTSVGLPERAKYRNLINKNKNFFLRYLLGILLNDIGEIKLPEYGVLIASLMD